MCTGRPEREPREDRHLGGGVAAVDVVGRVGLGVAEPLGLGQRLLEGDPPVRAISLRMKLVVPLTIPWTRSMRAPASDSCEHPDHRHDARDRALEAQLHA